MNADEQLKTKPNPIDSVDRILGSDEMLIPSSGFLAVVMECVQDEATAPAPIPFPWKRAVPGMVLAMCVLGACLRPVLQEARQSVFTLPHFSADIWGMLAPAGWVVLALGVALLSWMYASRMVRGSELF